MSPDRLIGARDVARMLGVHENTVRNMADDGRLPVSAVLPGSGFKRWRLEDIDRMRKEMFGSFAPATPIADKRDAVPERDACHLCGADNPMDGRYMVLRADGVVVLRTWNDRRSATECARGLDDWQGSFGPHQVVDREEGMRDAR